MQFKPFAFVAAVLLSGCNNEAAELLLTCEGGNIDACYRDGVKQSESSRPQFSAARKSFSTACMSAHHPTACNKLAILVRDAKGGPKDLHRAAELFEIACKPAIGKESEGPQVPSACVDLALALYDGVGIREDPQRAVELLGTACSRAEPNARACTQLGKAHAEGKGVEKKDLDKAKELYTTSCVAKHADACVAAGALVAEDRNGQEEAADLYGQACTIDARKGCFELATLHAAGKWPGASDASASEFYQKACSIDSTRGCFEAAAMMESGKVKAREGEIESLYNLACEHGHTEACSKRQIDLAAPKPK